MFHSRPKVYKLKNGYDIITSDRTLYNVIGVTIKKIGKVNERYQPSGKLLKHIPNEIKSIFFKIQSL
jgi:hypothetical protein